MRIFQMLAAALGFAIQPSVVGNSFRSATPSKRKGFDKTGLPSGYPGAKLARKAAMKHVGVKHPRGLRADGVTV